MDVQKNPFVVGVVTNNRKDSLLRLFRTLNEQATEKTDVVVVENGSNTVVPSDVVSYSKLSVALLKQKDSNIARARNRILMNSTKRYQWIVFIDDDCIPATNWLKELKQIFIQSLPHRYVAIQGKSISIPLDNPYAQASGALYALWFDANTHGNKTAILDTKCCLLNADVIKEHHLHFDEALAFASDIDFGSRLIDSTKQAIHVYSSWYVFHEERQRVFAFISHRVRLSIAFHAVTKKDVRKIRGSPLNAKIQSIMRLPTPFQSKLTLLAVLSVAYAMSIITLFLKPVKFAPDRVVR